MNIAVAPGTSSKQDFILQRYGLHVVCLDRDSPEQMAAAWRAYCRGGDDRWSREEFDRQNLVHFAVLDAEEERLSCTFGLEFCAGDDPGPHWWVEFCYFADNPYRRGALKRCAPAVVEVCHWLALRWCHAQGQQGVMRLTGRRGWSRILKSLQIERDELGFIYEHQERFRHGLQ